LTINTANFNVDYTSLALTGTKSVLINGPLDEGTQASTNITITTASTSPFLIGGAKTNGQTGVTNGQGISGGTVVINAPGAVTIGTTAAGGGAVVTGSTAVTLNSQSLLINNGSDVVGLGLTLNVAMGNTSYTNLNTNGAVSASAVNINDFSGIVTLSSGLASQPTILTVGTNPNGPGFTTPLVAGGAFNISAQAINYSPKGLQFFATGGIDGGSVVLNLSGVQGVAAPFKIGTGVGDVQADVAGTFLDAQPAGAGTFTLNTPGNIIGTNVSTAIQFGTNAGGNLSLNAEGFGATVSVAGVNGMVLNLFGLSSNSTTPLFASGATGGNGVVDSNVNIFGGNIQLQNSGGNVVTNGANLSGTALNLIANAGMVDVSGNTGFTASFSFPASGGTNGGTININAQAIKVGASGLALVAQGGSNSGGSITVDTSVTPVVVGLATSGQISLDVSQMVQNTSGLFVAGNVTVVSPGALIVNGPGILFGSGVPGIGGTLNLTSAGPGFMTPGFNLLINDAAAMTGLNYSTVTLTSGSTSPFLMTGASPTSGNGFSTVGAGTNALIAGAVAINEINVGGSVNLTGEALTTHALTVTTPSITFGANQVITVQPDTGGSGSVGVSGPLPNSMPTGIGGTITFVAQTFVFNKLGGVTLDALGDGATANSTGGTVNINDSSTTGLSINPNTFTNINVSNPVAVSGGQVAGTINITYGGTLDVNASVFSFNLATNPTETGGTLSLTAPNMVVSSVSSLVQGAGLGLAKVSFTTDSGNDFVVGGATLNGISDVNPTLKATEIDITTSATSTGGINFAGAAFAGAPNVQANIIDLQAPGNTVTFAAGQTVTALAAVVPASSVGDGGRLQSIVRISSLTLRVGRPILLLSVQPEIPARVPVALSPLR
jgi:collagen type VII alpha